MMESNCGLQEIINLWLITIEQRFVLGTPGESAKTVYGDQFEELISHKDGKYIFVDTSNKFDSEAEAWVCLKESFELYAKGREGKLFWRILPEISLCEYPPTPTPTPVYRGYMRLFIEEVKK